MEGAPTSLAFLKGARLFIITFNITHWLGFASIILPLVAFYFINRRHDKLRKGFVKHRFLLQLTKTQVARMQLDWDNIPVVDIDSDQIDHPFEFDLDITGRRSLLQLINTGVTFEGRRRLCSWLLERQLDRDTICERQTFIRELASLKSLRERFILHSILATRFIDDAWDEQKLLEWLNQPQTATTLSSLIIPTILSACLIATLLLSIFAQTSLLWCAIPAVLSPGYYLSTRSRRGSLTIDALYLRSSLQALGIIGEFLESYRYGKHAQLRRLCEPFFRNPDRRPSILVKRLSRLTDAARVENAEWLGLLVNTLLPWDVYIAYRLGKYKAIVAEMLPEWLDSWFELEALCSLANFMHLNPTYVMPGFAKQSSQDTVVFEAKGLGHPLIEDQKRVVNDFAMHHTGEVVLITGSNMAGKSTFLRTLGINPCLAYAGAPVNAQALRTSFFEIYACIKVTDSVADGYSYFYAEVRRLRGLLSRLEEGPRYPVFFLIDEIFKGTNNRERLIGSTAYIHALAGKRCLGAISTHDLELVKLSEMLPQIKNFHFREEVVDGRMVFDYKLRQGPCPTTNALKIMQLEGLPTTYPL
jgi:ABC-type multidrug transport system fused ATPase/permease subunit